MGVHKENEMFSQECAVDTTLTGQSIMINDHIGSTASSNELIIVIDGMLWQNAAMNNPTTVLILQFHAQLPTPVTAALQNNNVIPVEIFDG